MKTQRPTYRQNQPTRETSRYVPAMEWEITSDEATVRVEVPGVDADDIQIEINDKIVKLQWHRPQPTTRVQNRWRSELKYGDFYRHFALPFAIESDRTQATLNNGILTLSLPKQARSQPVKVHLSKPAPRQTELKVAENPPRTEPITDPWAA
ncbi:Hsp20/alpha crystallin family protein [Roseofilum casamattae]|uniref:Hsp20/alpha crystallin family protein n=1 Tax=Roseofilum casamattae BLCC-M143 TaxID=3022442 RepID=A0ABT7BX51_9CYAN|nr:Hsp20/alpha crystallin family protein [Roseofilum casamattae]MDJ1182858.1 Hsp20/alpha crystallin family protein [Roseofilum casamattae BLCC-M143]